MSAVAVAVAVALSEGRNTIAVSVSSLVPSRRLVSSLPFPSPFPCPIDYYTFRLALRVTSSKLMHLVTSSTNLYV